MKASGRPGGAVGAPSGGTVEFSLTHKLTEGLAARATFREYGAEASHAKAPREYDPGSDTLW